VSELDALMARSKHAGAMKERKHFTLSRQKAIEKQREFALRHPSQAVLELVQCAVFSNASYIAVDTRPDSLLVAWVGGEPLGHEVENIFDYLFADRGDARTRHLVQLAIGLNALLQRQPVTLRIESGRPGAKSIRLDLDANGEGDIGVPEDPLAGTYLYAEFRRGWLPRFSSAATDEHELVETRCLYTPVPILLNGSAPFGYRSSRNISVFGAHKQAPFDANGRRGVVAVHRSPNAVSGFRVVVGGVWVTTLPLSELADVAMVGVICDDNLRKTADQSDIVQDWRYRELLHAVQPVATKLRGGRGDYAPPRLPAIDKPDEETSERPTAPVVEKEALPKRLNMLAPRGEVVLQDLAHVDDPVFWVEPGDVNELIEACDPARFPNRILVVTAGQVATMEATLPDLRLFRLTTAADVDFIRGVQERNRSVRSVKESTGPHEVTLSLHESGLMPWYGQAVDEVPLLILNRTGKTLDAGGLEKSALTQDLLLPRVSLAVTSAVPDSASRAARGVLVKRAWELALGNEGDQVHAPLLWALLGQQAVPRFYRDESGVARVSASVPLEWPQSLRDRPMARLASGGELTFDGFLALMGTDDVAVLADNEELDGLEPLEQRFGFGHLVTDGRPSEWACVVGRHAHGGWDVLHARELEPTVMEVVGVRSNLRPTSAIHGEWRVVDEEIGGVVALQRSEIALPMDVDAGLAALLEHLVVLANGQEGNPRTFAMIRRAVFRVAKRLEVDVRVLQPSDGGARRTLAEIVENPQSRLAALGGIETAEAWTFHLYLDELVALEASIPLRYDDPPEVWDSLRDAEHPGWLLRQEVRVPGLRGWLGLRLPYDGTSGIVVRTTRRLLALPELDEATPCHGLLWPEDPLTSSTTTEQRQLLRLAGNQLYHGLSELLSSRLKPEERDTAERYGIGFVHLASRRGPQLNGSASAIARQIDMHTVDGVRWGTLDRWARTAEAQRPPAPAGVVLSHPPVQVPEAAKPLIQALLADALSARLSAAMGDTFMTLGVVSEGGLKKQAVGVDWARTTGAFVQLVLSPEHDLVARARSADGGLERELLLLEMGRCLRTWSARFKHPVDVLRIQQTLVAQRLK
jgi:hypothetical protein